DLQFRLDDAGTNLAKAQNALADKRVHFDALSQKKQSLEYELVQAVAQMESAQHRQQFAQQQLAQIAEQIAAFEQDLIAAQRKLADVEQTLSTETNELQKLTDELEQQKRLIDERQQAFRDGQLQLNSLSQEIEQNKAAILDLMRRAASVNSRIASIEIEHKNIAAQQARLAERRQIVVAESEQLDAKRGELQAKLDGIVSTITEQQGQLESKRTESQSLGKQIAQIGEQLGAAKEHRSGLISRQKLLVDLEARREGVSEGVKSVLRQRETKFPFVRGLVADILRVDVEHARVIEAALDGRDQWLVAQSVDASVAARDAFEELEGRVNVINLDELSSCSTGLQPVPGPADSVANGLLSIEPSRHGLE
ncbi:MAG: hypothetical protein JF612_13000, partial [Planctomycetia bacterium]|nr:hypothetical protein [Planctomycetia bacterium]